MSTVILRPWQRAAFDLFRAATGPDYLAVATPGAGKTTFALACARAALADQNRLLIVVAPTSHLKVQWSRSALRRGLQLPPGYKRLFQNGQWASQRQGRVLILPHDTSPGAGAWFDRT